MNVISVVKPHACHSCDKSFGRRYNLRRHIDNMHTDEEDESDSDIECQVDEPQSKKSRFYSETEDSEPEEIEDDDPEEGDPESGESDQSSDEHGSNSELEDNIAYLDWLEDAKETTNTQWNEKYEKYINEGMSEDAAKDKANRKIRWALERIFFNKYKDFLSSYLHLKDHVTHLDIVEEIEQKLDKGMTINRALNRVIPKHQAEFKGLFHEDEED